MKYKYILLLFLASCVNHTFNDRKSGHSSSGFAYIDKNVSSNLDSENLFISHNKLRVGTKINITNPENRKSLELSIKKKIKYDDFYKILISKDIVDKLALSYEFPFVEIIEIKSNKSFIAKEAITDIQEKKIANKAPVTKININNISKEKKNLKTEINAYSILVAEFYSLSSA